MFTHMEQLTLSHAAQTLMDMYYRDFRAEGEFFDYDHFEYIARGAWAKLLDLEAREWRKIAKQETGYYTIDINSEWLITEEVKLTRSDGDKKKLTGELKDVPFAFMFDKWSWAIQRLESDKFENFERITLDSTWKIKHLPETKIKWWYPERNKITILTSCDIESINVSYLPSCTTEGSNAILPVAKILDIAQLGYQVMVAVKQGIVDKTNNMNPNTTVQTEVDNVFANIKTKQQG